jgi:hypothetical protein
MDQLMVQVEKGGPRPCGVEGKVQLKCGDGRKVLVALGRAPFKKGTPLSERARPYCLLEWQGAQAPSGGLVISSSSLMQLRVDEKIDPLAVIHSAYMESTQNAKRQKMYQNFRSSLSI